MRKSTVIALSLSVLMVGVMVYGIYIDYHIHKDTTAWLNRAQVASNPEDMQEYLNNCRDGMEKWGLESGHAALIFDTPDNDLALICLALDRSIARCTEIKKMGIDSVAYQTALDDLRGQIRELDLHSSYGWFTKDIIHIMFGFLAWTGCLFIVLAWWIKIGFYYDNW